ncbi:MAG: hypothetical protein ACHQZR_00790 [Candidatus Limnocylindrales bacterium]
MTRPVAGGSTSRSHDTLVLALEAVLLVRGLLGLADAWTLVRTGARFIPFSDGAAIGGSPLWAAVWALVCLAAVPLLMRRHAAGWLLAAVACTAYLATGVSDAPLFGATATVPAGAWILFAIDVGIPALARARLISVRPWFLAVARRPGRPRA